MGFESLRPSQSHSLPLVRPAAPHGFQASNHSRCSWFSARIPRPPPISVLPLVRLAGSHGFSHIRSRLRLARNGSESSASRLRTIRVAHCSRRESQPLTQSSFVRSTAEIAYRRLATSSAPATSSQIPSTATLRLQRFDRVGRVTLTDPGRSMLSGELDRVTTCGIDRWLGGVHLQTDARLWRWDDTLQRII